MPMSLSLGTKKVTQNTSTLNPTDLSELWTELRSSDRKALSKLFSFSYPWLFKYGYRITPKRSLVEDAIQELFLNLWNKRYTIDEARSVKSYLLVSLRRMIFRKIKKRKNRAERNLEYTRNLFGVAEHIEKTIIEHENESSKKKQLKIAIGTLSRRQKEAIMLKFYRGLSNNEIAQIMNINKQSVYNHVSKAIIKMQSIVKNGVLG